MVHARVWKVTLLLVLAAAACAPRPDPMIQGDPIAVAALLALPEAQFFAQTRLGVQIGNDCPTLVLNQRFLEALIAHRFDAERNQIFAMGNSRAVDLEWDVARRTLQARYDVDVSQDNLCAIGEGEILRKSSLSAILFPVQ